MANLEESCYLFPDLIRQVHGRLAEVVNGKAEPAAVAIVPAMSLKKSVTHDAIYCLICGAGHMTLKRHLRSSHDLDPAAYRKTFDLQPDYPLTAPGYSHTRRAFATELLLGRK